MHFDLTDLRLFLLTIEAGSITGGANLAGLALASASARLSGMEAQAGVLLLERGRRGVEPTAAGTVLVQHARKVLGQVEAMRDDIGSFAKGSKGRVRLMTNTAALMDMLPEMLSAFLTAHPTIDLDVDEAPSTDVVRAVAAETADIGIAADHADMSGLECHDFQDDRLVLAVPLGHALASSSELSFAEALQFDFIGLSNPSALQRHLADHAARAGGAMRLRTRVASLDLICRMVNAGAGIAVVPKGAAQHCRSAARPILIPLTDSWSRRKLMIVLRRKETLSPYARRLAEHLLKETSAVPGSG